MSEVKREVIKKALVGLKMPILRDIARGRGLSGSGASEDLATRVAASYHWNEEEIARLVLDNEADQATNTERGFESRVFTFRESPTVADIIQRLAYVSGRYIRTGIARWFVFENAAEDDVGTSAVRTAHTARESQKASTEKRN